MLLFCENCTGTNIPLNNVLLLGVDEGLWMLKTSVFPGLLKLLDLARGPGPAEATTHN